MCQGREDLRGPGEFWLEVGHREELLNEALGDSTSGSSANTQ